MKRGKNETCMNGGVGCKFPRRLLVRIVANGIHVSFYAWANHIGREGVKGWKKYVAPSLIPIAVSHSQTVQS
jgi:hypothetical protein